MLEMSRSVYFYDTTNTHYIQFDIMSRYNLIQ